MLKFASIIFIFRLLGDEQTKESLIYATNKGHIVCNELRPRHSSCKKCQFQVSNGIPVTDFDINDSNELLVGAGQDGSFVVWNVPKGEELRRIHFSLDALLPRGVFVSFARFLPRNNNLIACALSNGVLQVLNVSTGKFNHDCAGATMLGKTLAVCLNATGSVLWAGNDRGYIESFRMDSTTGKIQVQKLFRLPAGFFRALVGFFKALAGSFKALTPYF